MTSGYILIVAVLILGGVIATVGDRIGTRVGKARLSLFKLRPRKTAILVTIMTGIVISASTLGILLTASEQLRKAIFDFESTQRKLSKTRNELQGVIGQKQMVEQELQQTRSDKTSAEKQLGVTKQQLGETNRSLQAANLERSQAQAQTRRAQAQTAQTQAALRQTQYQLVAVSQQALKLRAEITQLQAERNQVIAQREQEIKERDEIIQQREARLQELEVQQDYLAREVLKLEQEAQGLRQGNVAIQRGQVLSSAIVRIVTPSAASQTIDQLLRDANRTAVQLVRPGTNTQILQITKSDVEQLISQINDGQDYVVRIFSAANYLVGETPIQVFSNAIRNQVIFLAGDVVAATSLDLSAMGTDQIQQRINLLIAAANFRARSMGILTDSVQIGRIQDVVAFVEQLKQLKQVVELRAVAANVTYTSGPLTIELVASQNGQVLFRTKNSATTDIQQTLNR